MVKQQQSSDSLTTWHNDLKPVSMCRGELGNWVELSHIMVADR